MSWISYDRLAQNDCRVKGSPRKDFQALMLGNESGYRRTPGIIKGHQNLAWKVCQQIAISELPQDDYLGRQRRAEGGCADEAPSAATSPSTAAASPTGNAAAGGRNGTRR